MTKSTLDRWLSHLETVHPTEIELGLGRVHEVASRLELLPWTVPTITVAGTNGKGSVVAVCEAALVAMGVSVGVYTSPHFLVFNERIRVDGENAGDAEIIEAFEAIDAARGAISLTYFEFATLASLYVFRHRGVEQVVLEVGLGGRLDAVNIVDTDVAVITRIDLDHQDWLGDDLEAIGAEKAGILRAGAPAVIADVHPPKALCRAGAAASYFRVGQEWQAETLAGVTHMTLAGTSESLEMQLDGPRGLQPENVGAALQALVLAGYMPVQNAVLVALSRLALIGRQQLETVGPVEVILDVAHNPAAVQKLINYLSQKPSRGKTIALFSAMSDKDVHGMIRACISEVDAWFLADIADAPRAASASDLAAVVHEAGGHMISVSKNMRQAWRRAFTLLGEGDRLVVFGSFLTVAAALPLLEKDKARQASRETA